MKDFNQIDWDHVLEDDCRQIVRLGVREDLDRMYDWTTACLVRPDAQGQAAVVARDEGVACGLLAAQLALAEIDVRVRWTPDVQDGQHLPAGQSLAVVQGPARSLLTAERLVLNFIAHLSGIATLTSRYVAAVAGTQARIYDTRKTTVGWRRLEKYAVRCGGGHNHRTGLFDAILIKDNHLALAAGTLAAPTDPAAAVARARAFLAELGPNDLRAGMIIEVEVDTLEQLEHVLTVGPDIVLLDNMTCAQLVQAVERRRALDPAVELEASGGINLQTIGEIARTGVERISVGALTHSAAWLDVGLDWSS